MAFANVKLLDLSFGHVDQGTIPCTPDHRDAISWMGQLVGHMVSLSACERVTRLHEPPTGAFGGPECHAHGALMQK